MSINESLLCLTVSAFCLVLPCTGHAITFEEHQTRQGEDFCSTRARDDGFTNLCTKIAEINNITGYNTITGNRSCSNWKIDLYSPSSGSIKQTNENLLHCEYENVRDKWYEGKPLHLVLQITSRLLGRGKGQDDVMEYKLGNNVAVPQANREGMLTQVFGVN